MFLLPGAWDQPTGGYVYDRRIAGSLDQAGWTVRPLVLSGRYPWPTAGDRQAAHTAVASLPDGTLVLADGLAFGALPELAEAHARRLRWVALVHHPLAMESGLDPAQQQRLFDSERRSLAAARRVVTTSPGTARDLVRYGVDAARIRVVPPGTDAAPLAAGSHRPAQADGRAAHGGSLLCVATLTERKGHRVLIGALSRLRRHQWTLHCVGSDTHDPATAEALRHAVTDAGLDDRVHFHGAVDEALLHERYAAADLFVLPSFHEGYGMALAEALARGIPVISSRAGAIVDTVPADAGVLLAPGDVAAWQTALERWFSDAGWRDAWTEGARRARRQRVDWAQAGAQMALALEGIDP